MEVMELLPVDHTELDALLRLLDDETPEVRSIVRERLMLYGGDLSELLPEIPRELSAREKRMLSSILHDARRTALKEEWQVPGFGVTALAEDWELFEAMMRLLSDFLHDGITLRQSLSDALDLLTEEARSEGVLTADDLRIFLFVNKRMCGNHQNYYDPRNSDLAWCLQEGVSNPIGLCVIFMLTAQRLQIPVDGVDFPENFLCRYAEEGRTFIVNCFDGGRVYPFEEPDLSLIEPNQRLVLEGTADPGTILLRILANLANALAENGDAEDGELIVFLRNSLIERTML